MLRRKAGFLLLIKDNAETLKFRQSRGYGIMYLQVTCKI